MLTCIIRYDIDPTKRAAFEQYARNWGQCIPRNGAELIGYFSPREGSSTLAYGIYNIDDLAAYVTAITPIVALALSAWVEGYRPAWTAIVAVALILGGNVMALRQREHQVNAGRNRKNV